MTGCGAVVARAHGVREVVGSSPTSPTKKQNLFTLSLINIKLMITYEDFKKLDLRVAKIIEAERVENSEKLIKLQIDLGDEKRQIIAGIGKFYSPEDLINKKIVVLCNLEPRTLMGLESNGMLLAASNKNQISLLIPDQDIASGSLVK